MITCPSRPHPPSLPGWRSQPSNAFGSWRTGKFSSRSIWPAGRLPRQPCRQLLLSLSSAGAEDAPLARPPLEEPCPGACVGPRHGTGCTSPPGVCSCRPQSAGLRIPAKPSSRRWRFVRVLVAPCQRRYVFSSGGPKWLVTSLIPADVKRKVTCKAQG